MSMHNFLDVVEGKEERAAHPENNTLLHHSAATCSCMKSNGGSQHEICPSLPLATFHDETTK